MSSGILVGISYTKDGYLPRKAHLLLVDDDPSTLASLSRAFRLAGHEATVCDNANRALDLIRSEAFDLILSDVVMPGKNGIEFLEDLKKTGVKSPSSWFLEKRTSKWLSEPPNWAPGFPREASVHRQAAGHAGKRFAPFAPAGGKSPTARPPGKA